MDVVSFVNMKGGVGKTTLAVETANTLARRYKKRVLLIDVDPQFNATQCLMPPDSYIKHIEENGHTIVDIFDDQPRTRVHPVRETTNVSPTKLEEIKPVKIANDFYLLPGDLELMRFELGAASGREQRLARYLQTTVIGQQYDIVIIDTPPTPSAWMTAGLLASNAYVIPLKPEPLSRIGIDLLKGVVDRVCNNFGHELKCLGVILSMVDLRTRVYADTLEFLSTTDLWAERLFEGRLPQRTAIAREQGNQVRASQLNDSSINTALSQIAGEILERL